MLKNKLQVQKELGFSNKSAFFSPFKFKQEFILDNINYIHIKDSNMNVFTQETLDFLATLDNRDFLDLYLNTHKYFNQKQLHIFKEGVMNDMETHMRLVNYLKKDYKKIPISHLIPILRDIVLIKYLPTDYLFNLVSTNIEFREEVNKHPAIVEYLTQRNRSQSYIWGDLLPFPNDNSQDLLLRPMRNLFM